MIAGLVASLGAAGTAQASAGCDAVNAGAFNIAAPAYGTIAASPSLTFADGEVLSFTITRSTTPLSDGALFYLIPPIGSALISLGGTAPSETASHTVTTTALMLYAQVENVGDPITVNASCATVSPTGPNDSQKLRGVQIQGSKIVAQTSGQAIAGAVDQAIGSALNGQAGQGGTGAGTNSGTGGSPSALGGPKVADEAAAPVGPVAFVYQKNGWQAWANLRFTTTERTPGAGGFDGHQVNGTVGVGRAVAPGVVVGAFAGAEGFSYDIVSLDGRLKGDGLTGGAYFGWRLLPGLRYDLAGAYSRIDYDASAGTASGHFAGDRWLLSSGLTGTHSIAGVMIEPSARMFALWERQDAYTDSLGAAQAENGFTVGRASLGARASVPLQTGALTLTPYAGLYGDRNFSRGGAAVPAGTEILALPDGWSARAIAGIGLGMADGGSLTIGGEWGGIGTDTRQHSLTVRGMVPF